MAGQQWGSSRLLRQLADRPLARDPMLMRNFETGEAITHRARQPPPSILQRMAGAISQFAPRRRYRVDPVEARGRRRKWGGGSTLPDAICPHYSEAERAALGVIGEQVKRHGFCELPIEKIAEMAGVSRTTVQNAIRKARSRDRSDISVQLRPQPGRKNLTNIIRIISAEWLRWIKRSIGFKALSPSETSRENSLSKSQNEPKKALESESESESAATLRAKRQPLSVPPMFEFENGSDTAAPWNRW